MREDYRLLLSWREKAGMRGVCPQILVDEAVEQPYSKPLLKKCLFNGFLRVQPFGIDAELFSSLSKTLIDAYREIS